MLTEICTALNCDLAYFITGVSTGQQDYLAAELADQYEKLDRKHRRMLK